MPTCTTSMLARHLHPPAPTHPCALSHASTMLRSVAPEGTSSRCRARPKRMASLGGSAPEPWCHTFSLHATQHMSARVPALYFNPTPPYTPAA